eukprot:TRINITY_DN4411_c0_g1_i3.p1 TRINITY_DN4411_c0_g1~~TRINITY_DN4411_c0_g1_i3.p1  ORF type:complete len:567 (+),score=-19.36 TRINITY_DN4411_c0_g1_i3:340-2040(+)
MPALDLRAHLNISETSILDILRRSDDVESLIRSETLSRISEFQRIIYFVQGPFGCGKTSSILQLRRDHFIIPFFFSSFQTAGSEVSDFPFSFFRPDVELVLKSRRPDGSKCDEESWLLSAVLSRIELFHQILKAHPDVNPSDCLQFQMSLFCQAGLRRHQNDFFEKIDSKKMSVSHLLLELVCSINRLEKQIEAYNRVHSTQHKLLCCLDDIDVFFRSNYALCAKLLRWLIQKTDANIVFSSQSVIESDVSFAGFLESVHYVGLSGVGGGGGSSSNSSNQGAIKPFPFIQLARVLKRPPCAPEILESQIKDAARRVTSSLWKDRLIHLLFLHMVVGKRASVPCANNWEDKYIFPFLCRSIPVVDSPPVLGWQFLDQNAIDICRKSSIFSSQRRDRLEKNIQVLFPEANTLDDAMNQGLLRHLIRKCFLHGPPPSLAPAISRKIESVRAAAKRNRRDQAEQLRLISEQAQALISRPQAAQSVDDEVNVVGSDICYVGKFLFEHISFRIEFRISHKKKNHRQNVISVKDDVILLNLRPRHLRDMLGAERSKVVRSWCRVINSEPFYLW